MLDNLLLQLNFAPGRHCYNVAKQAVLAYYYDGTRVLMKNVYLQIAKEDNSSRTSVEKAMRDAVDAAWRSGEKQLWDLLFADCLKRKGAKPGNEDFCARIAMFLRQQSRLKPAYKELSAEIM